MGEGVPKLRAHAQKKVVGPIFFVEKVTHSMKRIGIDEDYFLSERTLNSANIEVLTCFYEK